MEASRELDGDRPLRRDAERNRQRILRAAADVFTERGLQASLDDVARSAGVGVGTVYRRFPDKESLVEALFEDRIDLLVGVAEAAGEQPDSWDGVVQLIESTVRLMAGDRGLREIVMFAKRGRDRVELAKSRMQPAVTRVIERAQRDGKLRGDISPTDVPLIEFMLAAASEYAQPLGRDLWRRYLTLILDGLKPARSGCTPMPETAASPAEMGEIMRSLPHRRRPGPPTDG